MIERTEMRSYLNIDTTNEARRNEVWNKEEIPMSILLCCLHLYSQIIMIASKPNWSLVLPWHWYWQCSLKHLHCMMSQRRRLHRLNLKQYNPPCFCQPTHYLYLTTERRKSLIMYAASVGINKGYEPSFHVKVKWTLLNNSYNVKFERLTNIWQIFNRKELF